MNESSLQDSVMLLPVSKMAETLKGSEIIKLAGEIKAKIAQGENIYNLTIGDFNPEIFPIPETLTEEIIAAYKNGHTNYPASNGVQELRESVSRFLHTRQGLEYDANQILISGGARPLIYAIYQTIIDPGDTVVFPVPSWNNNHYTHLSRGKAVFIETKSKNNFMPTAEDLKPYISKANLIALNSPLNPTGTTFGFKELEAICEMIIEENRKRGEYKKPVYLMYDQIYWALTYGDTEHFDPVSLVPEMKNYTIYVDGLSKAFAATGVRVGWAFGPQKIIDKMKAILGHVGAWAPKAEQVAVAKYLQNDTEIDNYLAHFKTEISTRLQAFYEGFKKLNALGYNIDAIPPQAAIYLTVKINLTGKTTEKGEKLNNMADVTAFLLNEAKLALVPFYAFGAGKNSPWFRLSVGTVNKEEIPLIFEQLQNAIEKLK
jgi:aspartate aminotransferase